ncbi:hypothetical protein PV325_000445 [Microctonus aethiopoides]|nr:hypothetical protein PV325_000445 [Microctonus aethiopoides]
MGLRINAEINWSLGELKKLVNTKNSCVHFKRAKKHVALHPVHLNNLNKALHEILSSSINFYDFELKGLLLSYKNPKLLSSLGSILYDSHSIHVNIEADFYVFKPEIGSVLSGIVNKKAINHIGVLVHKAFNVSILMNENDNEWRDHHTYVGQEVMFKVTHVDFKGRLPFIRGELLSDSEPDKNRDSSSENSNGDDSLSAKNKNKLKFQKVVKETSFDDTETKSTPKKLSKIKKHEENIFANIKIKREPDASDVENSSVGVTVRQNPIIVKTETKTKTLSIKRKYKEENENNLKLKHEKDGSDLDPIPKKKLKTIFSE